MRIYETDFWNEKAISYQRCGVVPKVSIFSTTVRPRKHREPVSAGEIVIVEGL
jgi:hypothetical protein